MCSTLLNNICHIVLLLLSSEMSNKGDNSEGNIAMAHKYDNSKDNVTVYSARIIAFHEKYT